MEGSDAARLGRLLSSAEPPSAGDPSATARCGLCDTHMTREDGVVEVAIDGDREQPDAWLCSDCYEYVVEEMGIAPTSVFKSGDRRTVVLPLASANGDSSTTGGR